MIRDNWPSAIKGAGALQEAIELIGTPVEDGGGDSALAKIIVDNEMALRALVRHALDLISGEL
jgi:hypothetical protein